MTDRRPSGYRARQAAPSLTSTSSPLATRQSTLINLILRFYDPTSGQVLVDGRDMRSLRLRDVRRHIGVVMQSTELFGGTVLEVRRRAPTHPHAWQPNTRTHPRPSLRLSLSLSRVRT